MQSKVELMNINFKSEAPILHVQMIAYIIYFFYKSVEISTYIHSLSLSYVIVVLPIDIKNTYRLSRGVYGYVYFDISISCHLWSAGHRKRVLNSYVDLSSW